MMRHYMQIVEMFDTYKIGTTFWYQPSTDTWVDCFDMHHSGAVMLEPEEFGLSKDDVIDMVGKWGSGWSYDRVIADQRHREGMIHNPRILKGMAQRGWVRIIVERNRGDVIVGMDTDDKAEARKTLAKVQEKGIHPTTLIAMNAVMLGDAVEEFARTGRIISDRPGSIDTGW